MQAANKNALEKQIDVLVTAPINKQNIQSEEPKFPGHTEYLASQDKGETLMLMLSGKDAHWSCNWSPSVGKVSSNINQVAVVEKLRLLNASLIQDLALESQKLLF